MCTGSRFGYGAILTATQAEEQLALPVFYILAGKAIPVFPGTGLTGPSLYVRIVRTKEGRVGFYDSPAAFKVTVFWEQWRDAVLPVLQSTQWKVREPLFVRAIETGRTSNMVALIGAALRLSFQAAGF